MLEFRTQGFNPYAVKYSPYYDNRVAVATAANFGIVGNGRLFVLGLTAAGIQVEKTYVHTHQTATQIDFIQPSDRIMRVMAALTPTMRYTT